MLMGMSLEEKNMLGLGMPSEYHYLTMVSPLLPLPNLLLGNKGRKERAGIKSKLSSVSAAGKLL